MTAPGTGKAANRYEKIIEAVFFDNYKKGAFEVEFTRAEFQGVADRLGIALPKNLGDVLYSFRYRSELPPRVVKEAPSGLEWVLFPNGTGKYRFAAVPFSTIVPTAGLSITKVPDATPGLISMYAQGDEQALLARIRYNRLLDVYSGVATYSLQSHLRTTIPEGQVETDEVYVGVDVHGAHYVFPVQAKGGTDNLSIVQIWQDFKMCEAKFPTLVTWPIAAQFMDDEVIALFSFDWAGGDAVTIRSGSERHYKLVPPGGLTADELERYRGIPAP